ncbi:MarR family winged helix-turn-helix transcriptional regulator [Paraburkholderia acidisoli]|uniref:MarR family transcriptional regulator n=1 Tax=Paraburkholderia acidisoli TaxID=2571748 RepID=A0A7Z2GNZ0_9BURK|nr:MarR family winged helix-turn-helix transcriptional regulator [Paraburkholderia acidisoli]QGZ65081.1 MarR family transcriptional regulator [Paraburkholderia acidisoli]
MKGTLPEDFLRHYGLYLRLRKITRCVSSDIDTALAHVASDYDQMSLLVALSNKEGRFASELAKVLDRAPASVTRTLDKLVEQSLVVRSRRRIDRRKVELRLTNLGDESVHHLCGQIAPLLQSRF